jgi:Flp pilus assembly pilin Flp
MEELQGMQLLSYLKDRVMALLREEDGQDGFEYLLVIGGVSVVLIAAIATAAPGLIGQVITGTCNAIATVVTTVSC